MFEKSDRIGGLLRYGIPEFKLEKRLIDPRIEQMREEGVSFQTGVHVGVDLEAAELRRSFDAVLLCCGAEQPRDLAIEGRDLAGIHFAMEFLSQQNHRDAGDPIDAAEEILATGKHVVILGGGDTGSDCVGTSHRQRAASVTSIELLERPPDRRSPSTPWPLWPLMFRTSSSHDEGGTREFGMLTRRFLGSGGRVRELETVGVRFEGADASGRPRLEEIPGSERRIPADLVLLAMGFVSPIHSGLLADLGVRHDAARQRRRGSARVRHQRARRLRRRRLPSRTIPGGLGAVGRAGGGARRRPVPVRRLVAPVARRARLSQRAARRNSRAAESDARFRLDAFRERRVGCRNGRGGPPFPNPSRTDPGSGQSQAGQIQAGRSYDFERLERVVSELAAAYRHQRAENAALRRELEQRGQRIRALDGKLLEANQKRQDVVKRIDELIAQIDQLDASFDSVDV